MATATMKAQRRRDSNARRQPFQAPRPHHYDPSYWVDVFIDSLREQVDALFAAYRHELSGAQLGVLSDKSRDRVRKHITDTLNGVVKETQAEISKFLRKWDEDIEVPQDRIDKSIKAVKDMASGKLEGLLRDYTPKAAPPIRPVPEYRSSLDDNNTILIKELTAQFLAAHRAERERELHAGQNYLPETDTFEASTSTQLCRAYANYYDRVLDSVVEELVLRAGMLDVPNDEAFLNFILQFQSHAESVRQDIISEKLERATEPHPAGPDRNLDETTIVTRNSARQRLETELAPEVSKARLRKVQAGQEPSILFDLANPTIVAEAEDRYQALNKRESALIAQNSKGSFMATAPDAIAIAEMYESELGPLATGVRKAYERALSVQPEPISEATEKKILEEVDIRIWAEFERLYGAMIGRTKQYKILWFPKRFRENMKAPHSKAVSEMRLALLEHRKHSKEPATKAKRSDAQTTSSLWAHPMMVAVGSALAIALLAGAGVLIKEFVIRPRQVKRERVEKLQQFVTDSVLPRLDSLTILGDQAIVMARLDTSKYNGQYSSRLAAFRRAYEIVTNHREIWYVAVRGGFDTLTALRAYHVLGAGADSANRILDHLAADVETHDRALIDRSSTATRTQLNRYTKSIDSLRKQVASGLH